jgi:hypothetical protein
VVSGRISVRTDPHGVRIDIAPPVSSAPLRRRLIVGGAVLAVGTIVGAIRIGGEWRQLAAGRETLPGVALVVLTAAVLAGAPAALFGLVALFFAEESLEIGTGEVVREISIFGAGDRRTLARTASTRLLWTSRPVPPWWTWTFRRLALVTGIGATLGNAEKEALERIVRRAIE